MFDLIIVGGGVAGLSAAALLAPHKRVLLLEREQFLARHASGVNAAIHQPLEMDAESARLARRSRELLRELCGPQVLDATGLLLVTAHQHKLAELQQLAAAEQVSHAILDAAQLAERVPALAGGETTYGLLLHEGGVLDLHLLISSLAARARERGAVLRTMAEVAEIEKNKQGVHSVRLLTGERVVAEQIVIAAGAWSAGLGRALGLDTPLLPMRRHLMQLRGASDTVSSKSQPVVWRLEDEVYFRPESNGVLASPCDESEWPAETPPSDPAQVQALTQKLARTAPGLADAEVQRAWACLRTFAPDRELVIGADPRLSGLYWLCGLGGRGMSVAPAAAELLTDQILRANIETRVSRFSVTRLLS